MVSVSITEQFFRIMRHGSPEAIRSIFFERTLEGESDGVMKKLLELGSYERKLQIKLIDKLIEEISRVQKEIGNIHPESSIRTFELLSRFNSQNLYKFKTDEISSFLKLVEKLRKCLSFNAETIEKDHIQRSLNKRFINNTQNETVQLAKALLRQQSIVVLDLDHTISFFGDPKDATTSFIYLSKNRVQTQDLYLHIRPGTKEFFRMLAKNRSVVYVYSRNKCCHEVVRCLKNEFPESEYLFVGTKYTDKNKDWGTIKDDVARIREERGIQRVVMMDDLPPVQGGNSGYYQEMDEMFGVMESNAYYIQVPPFTQYSDNYFVRLTFSIYSQ